MEIRPAPEWTSLKIHRLLTVLRMVFLSHRQQLARGWGSHLRPKIAALLRGSTLPSANSAVNLCAALSLESSRRARWDEGGSGRQRLRHQFTGIWVHSARGEFLGLISVPEVPANCAWGEDGQVLFIAARTSVYRIRMRVPGVAVLGPSFGIQ
jgi:hypothetical protein